MLSSAKIGTSSWRYYSTSVAKGACEYYAGHGEAPGRWFGRGLARVGLEPAGPVSEAQLEALFGRALNPVTGEALGRRWRADGVTGYDLTFSAPKSVSLLWALGDEVARGKVAAAHRRAVEAGLGYLDGHAALSRRGRDGLEQVATGGLVAALFRHRTSRAGDPQLHTHALVLNKLQCSADGQWRTVDGHEMYAHKKSAGALYQAALRAELTARLGVLFEERTVHAQAEIAGVPAELLRMFSKRTAAVAAEAGPVIARYERELGRELTKVERATVMKTAVIKTRPGKENTDVDTLHARWTAEAEALGWNGEQLTTAVDQAAARPRDRPLPVDEVLKAAVTGAGRRAAVFSRADLLVEVASRIPVRPGSADEVRAELEDLTDRALARPDAVGLGPPPSGVCPRRSDARYASAELLAAEARVLHRADGEGSEPAEAVPVTLAQLRAVQAGLDAGQRQAVVRATSSGERLTVWTAPAGTGKTTALGVAARVWTEAGYQVVGLAPSARAAAELADATGTPAETLAKWLHQQTRLDRMPPDQAARWAPHARTVLVVDEAGMASTYDLDTLTAHAQRAGAKVLLVGDPAQIGVVNGPGGMLAALAHRHGACQLDQVHRFTQPWERAASLQIRNGDPAGLDQYEAAGRIHPAADADTALDAVFDRWAQVRTRGGQALMMARSRTDVDQLNSRARAAAQAAGDIDGPAVTLGGRFWQAGDLLLARRNDRRIGVADGHVRNGDRYQVLAARPNGLLVQHLDSAQQAVLPASYVTAHADYGWATTINGAQGATTGVGILLARPGLDREHLYVGLTRGRHANHVHVAPDTDRPDSHHPPSAANQPDLRAARATLNAALATSGAQQAAHDVRDRARDAAAAPTRRVPAARAHLDPVPSPSAHRRVLQQLHAVAREQAGLRDQVSDLQRQRERLTQDLADAPRWRRSRRADLAGQLRDVEQTLAAATGRLAAIDSPLVGLQAEVSVAARQRQRPQPPEREEVELAHAPDPHGLSLLELLSLRDTGAGRPRLPALPGVTTPPVRSHSVPRRGTALRR